MNANRASTAPILFTVLLILLSAPALRAATYYVATNGIDTNPGTLAQPFRTVSKGITMSAASGDLVMVGVGKYAEHVVWTSKSLTLQGAGPGLSLIDGSGSGNCLSISGASSPAVIRGFTIQNGSGGGINVFQCQPTVTNCLFTGNSGGGMSLLQCNVSVYTCTFTNNDIGITSGSSAFSGADNCTFNRNTSSGIHNDNGSCSANNCRFINNGEGMANFNFASPSATSCTFSNNGSGIGNHGGNGGNVSQCTFVANGGNGIYNLGSNPTVTQCLFTNNGNANGTGGGMANQSGSNPTVTQCRFLGNNGGSSGGGMYNDHSSPQVSDCLFIGNNACNGGGMYNSVANPTVNNCTFSGNQVTVCGGGGLGAGMWNGSSSPVINNSIFWLDGGEEFFNGASSPALAYTDCPYAGTGNISADPLFVNAAAGNYHLQSGSPCTNAGSAAVPNLPDTDLDGLPRIQGSAPDMGAYETTPPSFGWYVDKALGSDSDPGTQASPFASVTRALGAAVNGNSIYIKQGNYGTDIPRITKGVRLANWLNAGKARIGAH